MLSKLRIKGFKSLEDVELSFPRLSVLFGPNAAGKSNLLESILTLSRLGTSRTLSEALAEPLRGYPIEMFNFPQDGLAGLLRRDEARFRLEAELVAENERFAYDVEVAMQTKSGNLSVTDEYLAALSARGDPKGNASIERTDGEIRIRRKSKPAHPRQEPVGLNHTLLSDPRLGGQEYRAIERCRRDLERWRIYYLDPRVAMRAAKPPQDVTDIGVLGENIAPFLYRLKTMEPRAFEAIKRTVRSVIPSIEDLIVDLDERRGTLDIMVLQSGTTFSSRILSEGTLRVLALSAIVVNPWGGSLVGFEEPENGVHPRRLELIADLLTWMACNQGKQVIVMTHSAPFCEAVIRKAQNAPDDIAVVNLVRSGRKTEVQPLDPRSPLFTNPEITSGLTSDREDGVFQGLLVRGLLDG
jgi:predicted ATPase